jgi:hypothetical protein
MLPSRGFFGCGRQSENHRFVKRVIRNQAGYYFMPGGGWTTDFAEAQTFPDVQSVIATKRQLQLVEVFMVLIINDVPSGQWDVVLPLSD